MLNRVYNIKKDIPPPGDLVSSFSTTNYAIIMNKSLKLSESWFSYL